jgi:hypothetical protein
MSTAALFAVGLLVTLVVGVAIVLLIYAAVLDGRYDRQQRRRNPDEPQPLQVADPKLGQVA